MPPTRRERNRSGRSSMTPYIGNLSIDSYSSPAVGPPTGTPLGFLTTNAPRSNAPSPSASPAYAPNFDTALTLSPLPSTPSPGTSAPVTPTLGIYSPRPPSPISPSPPSPSLPPTPESPGDTTLFDSQLSQLDAQVRQSSSAQPQTRFNLQTEATVQQPSARTSTRIWPRDELLTLLSESPPPPPVAPAPCRQRTRPRSTNVDPRDALTPLATSIFGGRNPIGTRISNTTSSSRPGDSRGTQRRRGTTRGSSPRSRIPIYPRNPPVINAPGCIINRYSTQEVSAAEDLATWSRRSTITRLDLQRARMMHRIIVQHIEETEPSDSVESARPSDGGA